MDGERQVLRTGKTVDAVCAAAGLSKEALALREAGQGGREFLVRLLEARLLTDAVAFLAHAMPKREGVWWVWSSAKAAAGPDAAPTIAASLEATRQWIANPVDDLRRKAFQAAEAADFGTPAGCAGVAAFFSGDTLGPPDAPPAPPGEFAAAKVIAGGVNLAAAAGDPEGIADRYRDFLMRGLEVADRIQLWAAAGSSPQQSGGGAT